MKNSFKLVVAGPVAEAAVVAPEVVVKLPPMPRGRGRPKKVQEVRRSSTILRMDEGTHYKLKQLALHDGLTLNELIIKSLREHCAGRGVEII